MIIAATVFVLPQPNGESQWRALFLLYQPQRRSNVALPRQSTTEYLQEET
jgi:hypothetical protein